MGGEKHPTLVLASDRRERPPALNVQITAAVSIQRASHGRQCVNSLAYVQRGLYLRFSGRLLPAAYGQKSGRLNLFRPKPPRRIYSLRRVLRHRAGHTGLWLACWLHASHDMEPKTSPWCWQFRRLQFVRHISVLSRFPSVHTYI